jgi:hypothetical protein
VLSVFLNYIELKTSQLVNVSMVGSKIDQILKLPSVKLVLINVEPVLMLITVYLVKNNQEESCQIVIAHLEPSPTKTEDVKDVPPNVLPVKVMPTLVLNVISSE